jgi:hypothetical protein
VHNRSRISALTLAAVLCIAKVAAAGTIGLEAFGPSALIDRFDDVTRDAPRDYISPITGNNYVGMGGTQTVDAYLFLPSCVDLDSCFLNGALGGGGIGIAATLIPAVGTRMIGLSIHSWSGGSIEIQEYLDIDDDGTSSYSFPIPKASLAAPFHFFGYDSGLGNEIGRVIYRDSFDPDAPFVIDNVMIQSEGPVNLPEPASLTLVALGLGALGFRRRRQVKSSLN